MSWISQVSIVLRILSVLSRYQKKCVCVFSYLPLWGTVCDFRTGFPSTFFCEVLFPMTSQREPHKPRVELTRTCSNKFYENLTTPSTNLCLHTPVCTQNTHIFRHKRFLQERDNEGMTFFVIGHFKPYEYSMWFYACATAQITSFSRQH